MLSINWHQWNICIFFFHTDFIFPVLMDVSKRKLNNDLLTWRQLKILRMNKTPLYNSQCVSINVMEFFTAILETSPASIWTTNAWIGKKPRKRNRQKLYFIYSIQLQKFNYKLQTFILRGYHRVYTMGKNINYRKRFYIRQDNIQSILHWYQFKIKCSLFTIYLEYNYRWFHLECRNCNFLINSENNTNKLSSKLIPGVTAKLYNC